MKVVAYIRVSTEGQCGDDRFGLEVQKEAIEKYCEENGHQIMLWVRDEGLSGAKERKGFDEIVYGDVSNPPYDAVVVAKTDRVARDVNVYYYYKMLLQKKGMKLISLSEDYEQFGAIGNMLEAFIVCIAQMERENILKRTASGRMAKAKRGGYAGGRVPYGYYVEDGDLYVDLEEAEVVKKIYQLKRLGGSYRSIAKQLENDGVLGRSGKPILFTTVKSVIDNRQFYMGYYRYSNRDEWVVGTHEPILDYFPEEWLDNEHFSK